MMVGGAFVYVCETCERGGIKDFEQRLRVYNMVRYNSFSSCGSRQPRYNGVAVYLQFHFM